MAKNVGYEVTARKAVCVDFPDGRSISFRPGARFEAHPTNTSVRRLLRGREVRQLGPYDTVPLLPIKLGATKKVRNILQARADVDAAKKKALIKLQASKVTPQKPESVNLGSLNRPSPSAAPADTQD